MALAFLLGLAVIAAVVAVARKRWHRASLSRAARARAGASEDNAIYVRSFTEIDDHLVRRWCACGGFLERSGEGSRDVGGRRYRVARMVCQDCESVEQVFFDTTDVTH